MNNPNQVRERLRFLLLVLSALVALITIATNGAFYMVGTYILVGAVVAFFALHGALCRCPHCGKMLSLTGDESHYCQHCGQTLPPAQTRGTFSGLYHQER